MSELLIGTSAYDHADSQLIRSAGIQWVRVGFPYPFHAPGDSTPSPEYIKARQSARDWAERGFQLIGSTPGLGLGTFQPDANDKMVMSFKNSFPAWYGAPGSEDFYRNYTSMCAFLAKDVGDIIPLWQVANEIDWPQFAGPFNLRQASELVLRTAIAMKEVNPALMVSTNCAGTPTSYYFLGRLFDDPRVKMDYCGIDQYYGTWQPGGPENWNERIAELYAITGGVKVLVNEWGFSSAGEVMTPADRESGMANCQLKKWTFSWGAGHNWDTQAEYLRRAFEAFAAHRDKLIGICYYRWEDQETCWQCGTLDCPVETAWGLVDVSGKNPKPSYYAFQEGVKRLTAENTEGAEVK
jgi:hypothetical protein